MDTSGTCHENLHTGISWAGRDTKALYLTSARRLPVSQHDVLGRRGVEWEEMSAMPGVCGCYKYSLSTEIRLNIHFA